MHVRCVIIVARDEADWRLRCRMKPLHRSPNDEPGCDSPRRIVNDARIERRVATGVVFVHALRILRARNEPPFLHAGEDAPAIARKSPGDRTVDAGTVLPRSTSRKDARDPSFVAPGRYRECSKDRS